MVRECNGRTMRALTTVCAADDFSPLRPSVAMKMR
jgi:hypothetical protein